MTELAIRDETAIARPAPQLPVPAMSDIDSWTHIVGQVIRLANEIYDTPFVPDGLRGSSAAVAAAILSGREMGLGPMTSLANIDVIRGKPTQKPLLMRAMILSQGHSWEDIETTDFRAVVRGRRKSESGWTTVTFTAAQAKTAGLDLGKYPADKLYARATSRLAKHKFADVIMGMAYSSDEVEDGLDAEIPVTTSEGDAALPPAAEPAKSRTAQRRTRTHAAPPAQAATPPAAAAHPSAQDAGGALPPLPGEEDAAPAVPDETAPGGPAAGTDPTTPGASSSAHAPDSTSQRKTAARSPSTPGGSASSPDETDYDTFGTVTPQQLTRIWAFLTGDYGFRHDEKDKARAVCAHIARSDLDSSKDLSFNQAKAVIDTLAHWKAQADAKGEHPHDYLIAVMVAQDTAGGEPGE